MKKSRLLQVLPIINNNAKGRSRGFTLIELLIVISIIGILVVAGVISYSQFLKTSRDAKRKGDLENIRGALQIYQSNTDSYPDALTDLTPSYIGTIPTDPQSTTSSYRYRGISCDASGACDDYTIGAYLETGPASPCSDASLPTCKTGTACNYCLGSLGQK